MKIELSPSGNFRLFPKEDCNCSLEVPASAVGAAAILSILQEQSYNGGRARIGEPSFPTQAQLNEFLRKRKENTFAKYNIMDLEIDL